MLGLILLLQTLTVAVSGPPASPEYLPLRVADAEGYFSREGLSVTLKTTRAESGAAEALAQNQVDLAATSLEALLNFGTRGAIPVPRLIFGLTAAPPVALLVPARHADQVRSLDDLPGLRVGLTTPGAPEHGWFGWLLARAGHSVAQVWIVSLGARGLAGAIESGDVHAALLHDPLATRLLADGRAKLLADFRTPQAVSQAFGTPTVNAAVFARPDRRLRDADLSAFAKALLAAEQRIRTAETEALAAKLPKRVLGGVEDFEARLETSRTLYLPDGVVSPEQLRETIALIRAHLPLPASLRLPRPEDMLHTEPLKKVLDSRPPA